MLNNEQDPTNNITIGPTGPSSDTTLGPTGPTINDYLVEINNIDQSINQKEADIEVLLNDIDNKLAANYENVPIDSAQGSCEWLYHRLLELKTQKLNLMIEKEGKFRQCNENIVNQINEFDQQNNQISEQINKIRELENQYVSQLEQLLYLSQQKIDEFNNKISEKSNQTLIIDEYKNYLNQLDTLYMSDITRLNLLFDHKTN